MKDYIIWKDIGALKRQMVVLEKEKNSLQPILKSARDSEAIVAKENLNIKEALRVSEEKVNKLNEELARIQAKIQEISSQSDALKAENNSLTEEKTKLADKISKLSKENEEFKARLSSISELKKAIRELKRQMLQVKIDLLKKSDMEKLALGNRGFIIKAGKSTNTVRFRIEVNPAHP